MEIRSLPLFICFGAAILIGCSSSLGSKPSAGPHLPVEAAAIPLAGRDQLQDEDQNGLAEFIELRMRLPTKRDKPAFATVEVFGQDRGSLRSITFASRMGSDVWRLSGPEVYVPICSTCAGGDSLTVKVDGEKLRLRGLSGPYVVMVELWEGIVWQSGAKPMGRYEFVTADYSASAFGWLPARTVKADVANVSEGMLEILVSVLVESPMDLELHGDIYEGGLVHATAIANVPRADGLHDVKLVFHRMRPDSGAVAMPTARIWLSAPSAKWSDANLWSELWHAQGASVTLGGR